MADFSQQLNTLREGIDELDSQLVELLAKRSALTTQVGQIPFSGLRQPFSISFTEIVISDF